MIKGIIFDKDGILFDSEPIYAKNILETFKRFGYSFSEDDYFEHWTKNGGSLDDFFRMHAIKGDIKEFRGIFNGLISDEFRTNLPIITGVPNALETLHKLYPMALATASDKHSTDLKLGLSGFSRFFKHIITKEDVARKKPDPECFLIAAQRLGIEPNELVVIEDSEKGVIAAHRAGMKCLAIPTRHTVMHDFSLAHKVLKDINELTPHLINSL